MGYWCPPRSSKPLERRVASLVGSIPTQSRQILKTNPYVQYNIRVFIFLNELLRLEWTVYTLEKIIYNNVVENETYQGLVLIILINY